MIEVLTKAQSDLIAVLDMIQLTLPGEAWSLAMEARPHVYEGRLDTARDLALQALATDLEAVKLKVLEARNEWSWLNTMQGKSFGVTYDRVQSAQQVYVNLRDFYLEAKAASK